MAGLIVEKLFMLFSVYNTVCNIIDIIAPPGIGNDHVITYTPNRFEHVQSVLKEIRYFVTVKSACCSLFLFTLMKYET